MDGAFYNDLREPFMAADIAAGTVLAATNKALYTPSNFPVLGGQYFTRIGKKLRIRLFGKFTTIGTAGTFTLGVLYGTGADANGVILASSAAITPIISQTNISWMMEVFVHCRSLGSAGTLFVDGIALFNQAVVANTQQPVLIPASAAVVSGACDLTAALIISIQALGTQAHTFLVQDMEVVAMN